MYLKKRQIHRTYISKEARAALDSYYETGFVEDLRDAVVKDIEFKGYKVRKAVLNVDEYTPYSDRDFFKMSVDAETRGQADNFRYDVEFELTDSGPKVLKLEEVAEATT